MGKFNIVKTKRFNINPTNEMKKGQSLYKMKNLENIMRSMDKLTPKQLVKVANEHGIDVIYEDGKIFLKQ